MNKTDDSPPRPGKRGCHGIAHRRKRSGDGPCSQKAIVVRDGLGYCYYHDPLNPKGFGQGYLALHLDGFLTGFFLATGAKDHVEMVQEEWRLQEQRRQQGSAPSDG